MKQIIFSLVLLVALATTSFGTVVIVNNDITGASVAGAGFAVTVNTTGAVGIYITVVSDTGASAPTLTDAVGTPLCVSPCNTFVPLTTQTQGSIRETIYYVANATVGSTHVFTLTGANSYASMCGLSFSGTKTTSPLDQQTGTTSAGTTSFKPGAIATPAENNEVAVSGIGHDAGNNNQTVDSPFTVGNQQDGTGNHKGCAVGYVVQTTATSIDPTWTLDSSHAVVGTNALFKSAGSGTTPARRSNMLLGVGD